MKSSSGEPEMVAKKMWVLQSAGSSLADSRKVPGAKAPFSLGEDGIKEQVTLSEKKPKLDRGSSKKILATNGILTDILMEAAFQAATMSAQAFVEKGIPFIKQKLADRRAAKAPGSPIKLSSAVPAPLQSDDLVLKEPEEPTTELDTLQWYRLFFEALAHESAGRAHRTISADLWARLASAHVVDDEDTQALAGAMRELTPQQLQERLEHVLDQHPELELEDPSAVVNLLFSEKVGLSHSSPLLDRTAAPTYESVEGLDAPVAVDGSDSEQGGGDEAVQPKDQLT